MQPPSRKTISIAVAILGLAVLVTAGFALKDRLVVQLRRDEMPRRGKRLTYLTIAVGLLVLGVGLFALRDSLLEQWYLWRLESEDVGARKTAADRLREMGSVRAIPKLLRTMREHSSVFGAAQPDGMEYLEFLGPHEDASALACFQAVRSLAGTEGRETAAYLLTALRESASLFYSLRGPIPEEQAEEVPAGLIMMALANAGEVARPGVPAIREFVEKREPRNSAARAVAIFALGEIHPEDEEVFRLVAETLTKADEDVPVRCAAADALRKIGQYHAEAAAVLKSVVEAELQDENEPSAQMRKYAGASLKRLAERASCPPP